MFLLKSLPKNVEDIILQDKYFMEHKEKFKNCIKEINSIDYKIKDINNNPVHEPECYIASSRNSNKLDEWGRPIYINYIYIISDEVFVPHLNQLVKTKNPHITLESGDFSERFFHDEEQTEDYRLFTEKVSRIKIQFGFRIYIRDFFSGEYVPAYGYR